MTAANSQPEEFKSFWSGPRLTALANSCLHSFAARNFRFALYTYEAVADVPGFVTLREAHDILPKSEMFSSHGGVEHFSDLFRYALLKEIGGWWVDTDVLCNTAEVPDCEIVFSGEEESIFSVGQLKFPENHPVLTDLLDLVRKTDIGAGWGSTGPVAFTEVIRRHQMERWNWPRNDLYPISWCEVPKLLLPEYHDEITERTVDAKFIHLYGAMLRAMGFTQVRPLHGSYLDRIYNRYCDPLLLSRLEILEEQAFRDQVKRYVEETWFQEFLDEYGYDLKIR